ncbi:MAG TPA: hypothetical protein VG452_01580, partial [Egibacteraceae bacterium]|nr:hypothetical protein [Egibacteraceae bacterium]
CVRVNTWSVPGQSRAVVLLRGAAERGEVGHAWAFVGPAGVGQERAARALAAALNCPQGPDGVACGSCPTCDRCLRGVHPDYWEFFPVGPAHRVSEVRDRWLRAASRSSAQGGWKLLRVVDADRMNDAAANAFLKALEEPPPRTVWVLEVVDPDELPDTVLSRCRTVRFVSWGPAELDAEARRLGVADPDERALAVRASLGTPAALRRLAAPGGLADLRAHRDIPRRLREDGPGYALVAARQLDEEVKRRTAALKADGKTQLESLAGIYGGQAPRAVVKEVSDRQARREREARTTLVQAALDDLVAWYRDCLLVGAGGDPGSAINLDAAAALCADAAALGPAAALRAIDLVLALRDELELNLQQGLALEALFLRLSVLTRGA